MCIIWLPVWNYCYSMFASMKVFNIDVCQYIISILCICQYNVPVIESLPVYAYEIGGMARLLWCTVPWPTVCTKVACCHAETVRQNSAHPGTVPVAVLGTNLPCSGTLSWQYWSRGSPVPLSGTDPGVVQCPLIMSLYNKHNPSCCEHHWAIQYCLACRRAPPCMITG